MTGTKRFTAVFILGLLVSCAFQFLAIRPVYSAVPTITSIAPDLGATTSSTRVTVTGQNFEPGAKVSLLSGGPFLAASYAYINTVHSPYDYLDVARLYVIDIDDPSRPVVIGSDSATFDYSRLTKRRYDVYVAGDYAYQVLYRPPAFSGDRHQ